MKKIKHFDTFAGIGGFHIALEQSIGKENIECIGFSEIDKYAIQTYLKNFPESKNFGSISEIDIASLPDFNLLTGGFPCQDVSVAGKQDLEGGRTILIEFLLQILEIKKPENFVLENVKGLLSEKFKPFFNSILERILKAGYYVEYKVLNTKEHGIPQNRERVYLVGSLNPLHDFKFPQKEELQVFLKDILEEEVDKKFYLSDEQFENLKKFESNARICEDICSTLNTMQGGHRQPKIITNINPSGKGMNGNVFDSDGISPTITTNKGEGSKIFERAHGFMKAREYTEISPTTRSQVQGNTLVKTAKTIRIGGIGSTHGSKQNWDSYEVKGRIRKLTPIECERLQGFPNNWTEGVSNSQRYKQCGNAITVRVAKKLFDNLFIKNIGQKGK